MAHVVHRTTVEYKASVHTPDYPSATWIIDPDLSALVGVATKYWKVSGESVLEMTQAEKDVVNADNIKGTLKSSFNTNAINNKVTATCTASGLVITTNVTDIISNDQQTIVADSGSTKKILVCFVYNTRTTSFKIEMIEKLVGGGAYPSLKIWELLIGCIKEYSVVASGSTLVEDKTWLT